MNLFKSKSYYYTHTEPQFIICKTVLYKRNSRNIPVAKHNQILPKNIRYIQKNVYIILYIYIYTHLLI